MDLTSNEPFWLVRNGLIHFYPSLREDIKTEILIVGGGITGALMAHQCMEDGYRTTLIDRREIANGSTSATTSMLQYEIDLPLYKLIEVIGREGAEANYWAGHRAIDELKNIVEEINSDSGFEKKESLYYAAFKKDIPHLKKEFKARKACGLHVEWLSDKEIQKKYGLYKAHAGILSDQAASVDAFRLTHDLLKYNVERGLKVYDKTKIADVRYTPDSVILTTDFDNAIQAERVVYCTGYESTELIKDDFVKLLSTFVIIGEPREKDHSELQNTLFWNTAEPYLYFRTTEDYRLLVGGEDEEFVNPGKRDKLISEKSRKLQQKLKRIFPDADFRRDFSWAGTFGETKDGLPYIGKHPDFKNSYFLLGFGGNGITFSILGRKVISDMLRGKKHPLEKYFRFSR